MSSQGCPRGLDWCARKCARHTSDNPHPMQLSAISKLARNRYRLGFQAAFASFSRLWIQILLVFVNRRLEVRFLSPAPP